MKNSEFVSRSYVSNPTPIYIPKKGVKYPRVIHALCKAVKNNVPSQHPIWKTNLRYHPITKRLLSNTRSMNLHRSRSINAILECLAAHVNLVTGKVFITLKNISDSCGLTTYNRKGIPCYSRVSRAINEHIEAIGAIYCERIWDETTGSYIPNLIWVTELFFVLIGYEYGKFLAAQNQQLAWENKKLVERGKSPITVEEACRRAKIQHVHRAFLIRTQKQVYRKQLRRAKKLISMSEQDAKYVILKDLTKLFSYSELIEIGYVELKRQVEYRYHAMKKLLSTT